ncbi:unnamed protein product, partial [Brassica rapa subsp. narinosa]
QNFTIYLLIGGYNSIDCHPHWWRASLCLVPFSSFLHGLSAKKSHTRYCLLLL